MKENQKDQLVTDNPNGQKNQDNQSNQDAQASQKPLIMVKVDEETAGSKKEHEDTEHPHEYKTPVVEQNRQDKNQGKSQTENSIREMYKNQYINQGAE